MIIFHVFYSVWGVKRQLHWISSILFDFVRLYWFDWFENRTHSKIGVRFCSIAQPNRTIGVRLGSIGFLFGFVRLDRSEKTWKTLPSLFVRLISYDIKCTSSCQSFDHVTVRHVWDDPGILFIFVDSKFLESLGWIFHEKLANYRPCSRISRNKIVISRITRKIFFHSRFTAIKNRCS